MNGDLGLRLARSDEKLGEARPLSARQLVVADAERPVAVVFGEMGEDAGVTRRHRADGALRAAREGRAAHQRGGGACGSAAETLYT